MSTDASARPYKFSKVERSGRITMVTLSRPEVMNALHEDAHLELHGIFDAFAQDPEQWVAIVTGAGERAFCAGYDMKSLAEGDKEGWAETGFAGLVRRYDCAKPFVAAVNGVALGGGFEVALACDVVVASRNAKFALPEARFGLAAVSGGLHRLPRQIGLKRAMGLILTGRSVSAEEGFSLGFVNEVVPEGDALQAAVRWAEEMCACSPLAVRAAKEAVQASLTLSLAEAIGAQATLPAMKAMHASRDFLEGPRAFAEKRAPQWTGS